MIDTTTKPDDDYLLDFNIMLRKRMIDSRIKNGIPESLEEQNHLMNIAESMDKTILSRRKLTIDDENNKSNNELTKALANILLSHKAKVTTSQKVIRDIDLTEDIYSITDIVEGETDIGHIELSLPT